MSALCIQANLSSFADAGVFIPGKPNGVDTLPLVTLNPFLKWILLSSFLYQRVTRFLVHAAAPVVRVEHLAFRTLLVAMLDIVATAFQPVEQVRVVALGHHVSATSQFLLLT